jgi:hypothetical protein
MTTRSPRSLDALGELGLGLVQVELHHDLVVYLVNC